MAIELKQLLEGLDADVISNVEAKLKENGTKLNAKLFIDGDGEHYIPAARLSQVTTERNQLQNTLAEQEEEIKKISSLTQDNEQAQAALNDLKAKLDNQSKLSKRATILSQLATEVKDSIAPTQDLLAFLNTEEISVKEDGTVIGLTEQLNKVREERKYLFKEAQQGGTGAGTGDPGTGGSGTKGTPPPKEVGTLGKMLAERSAKTTQTEDPFWK